MTPSEPAAPLPAPVVPRPGPKPSGAFRVLHTADWHLGKRLGPHCRAEEHGRFLGFLLETIRQAAVDVLIIAGDVFDSANPPQTAQRQYYDFLSGLRETAGGACAVIVVAGNHDSPGLLEAPRELLRPLNFHVVGTLPAGAHDGLFPLPDPRNPRLLVAALPFLRDADLRVGLSGKDEADIRRELAEGVGRRYAEAAGAARDWRADRGVPTLATGHLTVVGGTACDSERDIHVGGLGAVGAECFPDEFCYVALGHLHRPQSVGGRDHVRYAGSPLPLSFSEADDAKEVRLLDFNDLGLLAQTALPVPPARRLTRLRAAREELNAVVAALAAELAPGALAHWVELTVQGALPGEDFSATLEELTRAHGVHFLHTRADRDGAVVPSFGAAEDDTPEEDWAALLDDPAAVFARRLAAQADLPPALAGALSTAFEELRNLHAERERERERPGRAPGIVPTMTVVQPSLLPL